MGSIGNNILKRNTLYITVAAIAASNASAQNNLTLEEVVVTATKKDEMVQDVASTVNVITADKLRDLNVFDFKDVETLTPGLSLTNATARTNTIGLRGVSFDPESRTSAAVVTYINGVAVRPDVAFQQIYDVSRIEVLRGPQGTLQGETSPAGSIQIYTNRANLDAYEGDIIHTFSDDEGVNSQVALSIPVIEGVLGVRFAGVYDKAETGVKTVSGDVGTKDAKSGRFTVSWLPTDELDINLMYQYLESRSDNYDIVQGVDSTGQGNPTLSYSNRNSLQEGKSVYALDYEFTNLEVNYEIADHLITSVSGYLESEDTTAFDLDSGNIVNDFIEAQTGGTELRNFTQELRITNTEGDFWEYTAGLYYSKTDSDTIATTARDTYARPADGGPVDLTSRVGLGPAGTGLPGAEGNVSALIPVGGERYGVFMDHKFYLTDATSLVVGARWQKTRDASQVDSVVGPRGLSGYAPAPDTVAPWFPFNQTPGTPLASLIPEEEQLTKSIAWTGGVKLSHDLDDNVMVYGSYDRSFRPGGFIITPDADQLTSSELKFDEETSNAYELGFKSQWQNGRYQVNGAVFYQDFSDYITRSTNVGVDSTSSPGEGGVSNATLAGGLTFNGDSIVRGAEVEFTGLLTENWISFLGLSYTDSKFDGAEVPCNQGAGTVIPGGQSFTTCQSNGRSGAEPNWSISASSEYTHPLETTELFVRGLYKFTDNRADDVSGYEVPGYGLFDLYTGVRSDDGAWEISLWSKNLFDKEARTALGQSQIANATTFLAPAPGVVVPNGRTVVGDYRVVSVVPERTVGITAKFRFGAY